MLKFSDNKLQRLDDCDLKSNDILERYGLQKAIVNSWDEFRKEIGMPQLYLVGQEVCPHECVQNSVDILAFDPVQNLPVVFELKRSKNKLQLLQALSYASMISSWTIEEFMKVANAQRVEEIDDLEDSLQGIDKESNVRIVLIAEKFDPEVIITSDWLYSNFDVDIISFGIDVFSRDESIYFSFNQKYPLPELQDIYELRKVKASPSNKSNRTWDNVKEKIKYSWGARFIDYFSAFGEGDALRRRWPPLTSFRSMIPFDKVAPFFCEKWMRIYLWGKPEDAEEHLKSKFGNDIDMGEWRDGYWFKVHKEEEAEKLKKWLNLGGK